ncbi:MAG TPA: tautomerase family protein, partial [Polyangiales bacterium]
MAQFKIYGHADYLREQHARISELLHAAAQRTLQLPADKRFHRFIPLESWQFVTPADRSRAYLIIECVMFTGRTLEARKALIRAVMDELSEGLGISVNDIE